MYNCIIYTIYIQVKIAKIKMLYIFLVLSQRSSKKGGLKDETALIEN